MSHSGLHGSGINTCLSFTTSYRYQNVFKIFKKLQVSKRILRLYMKLEISKRIGDLYDVIGVDAFLTFMSTKN